MSAFAELTEELQDRITDTKAKNGFGMRAFELAEERAILDIIASRYKDASERFVQNTKAIMANVKPDVLPNVLIPVTDEQSKFHTEGLLISWELRLDIRSFYMFAKIYLDKIARFVEFYFGHARGLSLDSHHKLTKHLANYCSHKGLRLPRDMPVIANDLKDRISDYRDQQVSHDKSANPTGTIFTDEDEVRISRSAAPESESLPDLTEAVDEYLLLVVQLMSENEA